MVCVSLTGPSLTAVLDTHLPLLRKLITDPSNEVAQLTALHLWIWVSAYSAKSLKNGLVSVN